MSGIATAFESIIAMHAAGAVHDEPRPTYVSLTRMLSRAADERGIPGDESFRVAAFFVGTEAVEAGDLDPHRFAERVESQKAVHDAIVWRRGAIEAKGGSSVGRVGVVLMLSDMAAKSHALAAAVMDADDGLYVLAADVTGTTRNEWSENKSRWRRWETVPLLAIDQLDERDDFDRIFSLVLRRYEDGLVTLLACPRYRAGEIRERIRGARSGATLISRLVFGQESGANGLRSGVIPADVTPVDAEVAS